MEYTTKRGKTITVQAFPHLMPAKVQVAAEKKAAELYPATMPTYDVELMGGGFQTFEHDDRSVETDQDRAALQAYKDAMQKRTAYINEKMMQFYLITGTDITLPEDRAWEKRQEFFGIEIPSDANEKMYHYITTELLMNASDLMALVDKIMQASGIDEDTLAAARETFRRIVGQETNTVEGTARDDPAAGEAPEMVYFPPVPAVSSNGEMADLTVPVG